MQLTIETFERRKNELNQFFDSVQALYRDKAITGESIEYFEDDFLKILKSNIIVMTYNLVEASIIGGMLEIYDALRTHGVTYKMVRDEIRKTWFAYKFNQVYDKNAHYNSYRDKASEIINSILSEDCLAMDRKALNFSGNIDADTVRDICLSHGIDSRTSPGCKGGRVLTTVKNKRNDLAHGTMSFSECGREFTLGDLKLIKDETFEFLNCILGNMKVYYDSQLYIAARAAN